ncbi:tRNA lysidine(34) synthetase TilS [Aggregicoccus sp. 17bor-14]|nr:tRNA lysidine(34) synthetase TilS [Simulacricoccus sp. 17bor-14]MRI89931.1 tRNA lysidine(34) synthetase TilS [Aggregicoccus sp. 17bor-14]
MLLAVSGGADSVALLVGTAQLAQPLGLRLEVATLDHGLRPEASAEVQGVLALAQRLGLPAHARTLALGALGAGLEARARTARYAALEGLRAERALDAIATGHTASEQAETLLMRLVRGSSLQGARAILPSRGRVVRPLLGLTRAQLRAFLAEQGVPFHEDPMNADPRFLRTRVRHAALPALEAAAGFDVAPALARFSALAAEDAALLEQLAEGAWTRLRGADGALDAVGVRALALPLRRRVLARLLAQSGAVLDAAALERALEAVSRGGQATLSRGLVLRAAGGRVRCVRAGDPEPFLPQLLARGAALQLAGSGWRVGEGAAPPRALHLALGAPVQWPLSVRARRPGERVGRGERAGGSRKVQDLLVDARVPAELRDQLPVIADAQDRVLWIPGVWSPPTRAFTGAPSALLWALPPPAAPGAARGAPL